MQSEHIKNQMNIVLDEYISKKSSIELMTEKMRLLSKLLSQVEKIEGRVKNGR